MIKFKDDLKIWNGQFILALLNVHAYFAGYWKDLGLKKKERKEEQTDGSCDRSGYLLYTFIFP